jgi:tetratricopeptide (TPR) repeat protein
MPKAPKTPRSAGGQQTAATLALSNRGFPSLVAVWPAVKTFCAACYGIASRLLWILVVVIVATILVQGLTQSATVFEPISVPKSLADSGYTPEVASRRLRDAIDKYATSANTQMKNPEFALHGDLPNIIVPTVGISLDAVVTTMRTLLRSTRSRSITGEFTIKDKLLWLHLRLDGHELYVSTEGGDPEKPDDLLAAAIPKILEVVRPYFVAVAQHRKDPEHSLETVTALIGRLPESDENVPWLYNLKGNIYRERHNDTDAAKAYNKALSLNASLPVAHLNLGNIFKDANKLTEAIAEYNNALGFNPIYPLPHFGLGLVYERQSKHDLAIAEYRKVIELDPKHAASYNNLGAILAGMNRRDEAIAEYRNAIEINPNYALAHTNLGNLLSEPKEKIAEFREAIRSDPKFVRAYRGLARLLTDPAEKEAMYRQVVVLTPDDADAHFNLGLVLAGAGKRDEAIASYKAALAINPKHEGAQKNLPRLLAEVEKPG